MAQREVEAAPLVSVLAWKAALLPQTVDETTVLVPLTLLEFPLPVEFPMATLTVRILLVLLALP